MPDNGTKNLLKNGDFEQISREHAALPNAWEARRLTRRPGVRGTYWTWTGMTVQDTEIPLDPAGRTQTLEHAPYLAKRIGRYVPGASPAECTADDPHTGTFCATLRRTGDAAYLFLWRQSGVRVQPDKLYRLRLWVKADAGSLGLVGFGFRCRGAQGPAWLKRPVKIDEPMTWQPVEVVFRPLAEFNPIHSVDVELRMFQRQPGIDAPDDVQQVWFDDVSLEPLGEDEPVLSRVTNWMRVAGRDSVRYADVELGAGCGIGAHDETVELLHDGEAMQRVDDLGKVRKPSQFAWSERSRRVYVHRAAAGGRFFLRFVPKAVAGGNAYLNLPEPRAGRALKSSAKDPIAYPLEIAAHGGGERRQCPLTQGIAFPLGQVADARNIRLLDPAGEEVPLQVTPTSYWEDDSIKWATLDFQADVPGDAPATYTLECGRGIRRARPRRRLTIREDADAISVNTGPLKFKVSRTHFRLIEDVRLNGSKVLSGSPEILASEAGGLVFRSDLEAPYVVAVEEAGPLHAVIVARGWHRAAAGGRFLTYTTRIHAHAGQSFVRVFHTVTNRHEESVRGTYDKGGTIIPADRSSVERWEAPEVKVADVSLRLPLRRQDGALVRIDGAESAAIPADGASVVHRQGEALSGELRVGDDAAKTGHLPGTITVTGDDYGVTAAVFNYARLFPKELRVVDGALELGLIPASDDEPVSLFRGSARTTEVMLAFHEPAADGADLARAFHHPLIFSCPNAYCESGGVRGFKLIALAAQSAPKFDGLRLGGLDPQYDDWPTYTEQEHVGVGLTDYGDFGARHWMDAEYDSDLGYYIRYMRGGTRSVMMAGRDVSRHFIDVDILWHDSTELLLGSNLYHAAWHYGITDPSGHSYSIGALYYYLLTGDRRGLEAARSIADACYRYRYDLATWLSTYPPEVIAGEPDGRGTVSYRNFSASSRYPLETYKITGEKRFLDTARAVIDEKLRLNAARPPADRESQYRYPEQYSYLYEKTGDERYLQGLKDCAARTLEVDEQWGEYGCPGRAIPDVRAYGQTIYNFRHTGDRACLDWTMNTFDRLGLDKDPDRAEDMFRDRTWTPIVSMASFVPYRAVALEHAPCRIESWEPTETTWTLKITNVRPTAVTGSVVFDDVPDGITVAGETDFQLDVLETRELSFRVTVAEEIADGRWKVRYSVNTAGADGHEAQRHAFFAVHTLRDTGDSAAELLLHAPFDDPESPVAVAPDGLQVRIRRGVEYVPGVMGNGLSGLYAGGMSLHNVPLPARAGTIALWTRWEAEDYLYVILMAGSARLHRGGMQMGRDGITFEDLPEPPAAEQWHHIAITWRMKGVAYYLDGRQVGSDTREDTNHMLPSGPIILQLGEAVFVDDLRIYSAALPAADIEALHAKGTKGYGEGKQ